MTVFLVIAAAWVVIGLCANLRLPSPPQSEEDRLWQRYSGVTRPPPEERGARYRGFLKL